MMLRVTLLGISLGLILVASGCRMCASPYDYCGPTYTGDCGEACDFYARAGSILSGSAMMSSGPYDDFYLEGEMIPEGAIYPADEAVLPGRGGGVVRQLGMTSEHGGYSRDGELDWPREDDGLAEPEEVAELSQTPRQVPQLADREIVPAALNVARHEPGNTPVRKISTQSIPTQKIPTRKISTSESPVRPVGRWVPMSPSTASSR